MHYLLFYDAVADYIERRAPYRAEHLSLVKMAHERGEIIMAGALSDPADGAVLVFNAQGPTVAEDFARNDPYVKAGLITRWRVRPWNVVVGG